MAKEKPQNATHNSSRAEDELFGRDQNSGEIVFAGFLLFIALLLLALIAQQTTYIKGMSFVSQPRFWPGLCLIGFALCAAIHFYNVYKSFDFVANKQATITELRHWVSPLEYAIYFMAYVYLTQWLGYLFSTLLFSLFLVRRCGYSGRRWSLSAAGFALIVVLFFKNFLQIKIPGGVLYEWFPAGLRNFMILYL